MREVFGAQYVTLRGRWERPETDRDEFTWYKRAAKLRAAESFGADLSARITRQRGNLLSGTFTFRVSLASSNNAETVAAGLLAAVVGSVTCRAPEFTVEKTTIGRYRWTREEVAV